MLRSPANAGEVKLTAGLGDGVALILGPGGSPTVPDAYMSTVDQLYLEPLGFTGTTVAVPHDYADLFNSRIDLENAALVAAVNAQMATGDVSPADPLVIMGYSESATASTGPTTRRHPDPPSPPPSHRPRSGPRSINEPEPHLRRWIEAKRRPRPPRGRRGRSRRC